MVELVTGIRVTLEPPATEVHIDVPPAPPKSVVVPVAGPQGPVGPPGGGAYVHVQSTPAATWTIPHGLGRVPHSVSIYQSGELVYADVHVDAVNVVVTFPSAATGEVHII